MSVQKINPDTYVGNTGKQLKDIKSNSDNITNLINKVNNIELLQNVYENKYVYNGTGDYGYYEIFRIGTTGGWGGRAISFLVQTHNSCIIALGCIEYYNNTTINARYMLRSYGVALYYKKNTNNTVSVYANITERYSPTWVKIISSSNPYDNPYPSGVPNSMSSLPSGLTEFGGL